jgi:hypothetical protein
MTESEFNSLDPLADAVNEASERWFSSPEFAELKSALQRISAVLPPTYSVSIDVDLRVFDAKRERDLNLLTIGINACGGEAPHGASSDSSIHRYTVGGEICAVPHDRCPHCWGQWDWKLQQPACPHCRYALGKDIRLLLDRDLCPHCERGAISARNPACPDCGFRVDPSYVYWG